MTIAYLRRGLGNMLISIRSLHGFQKPKDSDPIPTIVLAMVQATVLKLLERLRTDLAPNLAMILGLLRAPGMVLALILALALALEMVLEMVLILR